MKFMHKEVRRLGDPCMSILYPLYERRKARSIAGALLHDLFNFLSSPVPFRKRHSMKKWIFFWNLQKGGMIWQAFIVYYNVRRDTESCEKRKGG